jgi:hypothetical protein
VAETVRLPQSAVNASKALEHRSRSSSFAFFKVSMWVLSSVALLCRPLARSVYEIAESIFVKMRRPNRPKQWKQREIVAIYFGGARPMPPEVLYMILEFSGMVGRHYFWVYF